MHPEQIKAHIRMRGTTPSAIADEMGLSRTTVSQVIRGRGISERIARRISEIVGIPASELWPGHYLGLNRGKAHSRRRTAAA